MSLNAVAEIRQVRQGGRTRRLPRWLVVPVVILAATAGLSVPYIRSRMELNRLISGLTDPNTRVRAQSCYSLSKVKPAARAVPLFEDILRGEEDPGVVEAAAYALQRYEHLPALPLVEQAIERLPPTPAVAKMISYLARLGGNDARATIESYADDDNVWWRMGAALGLLELGEVRGADILLEHAADEDTAVRAFATDGLRRLSAPVAEMVGEYVDLSTPAGAGFSDEQLAALRGFWTRRDRTRELRDYLDWAQKEDTAKRSVERLLHARKKAARWVGLPD